MPIIENTYGRELYELHKAVEALDKALDIRGKQDGAIFLQSYYLIQDAARLYEENDRLRVLVLYMYQIMTDRRDGPHEQYHGKPCESCAEADEVLLLEKEVARLRAKMEEWARLFDDNARDHEQYGHWMEAEDWVEYAHDMRIDILGPDKIERVQA